MLLTIPLFRCSIFCVSIILGDGKKLMYLLDNLNSIEMHTKAF